jgi:hypothetical protein
MLVDQPCHERTEGGVVLGEHKVRRVVRPVEFVAGGECRDPDLPNRSIGCDHELAWWLLKYHIQRAAVLLDFKFAALFRGDQALLQRFQGSGERSTRPTCFQCSKRARLRLFRRPHEAHMRAFSCGCQFGTVFSSGTGEVFFTQFHGVPSLCAWVSCILLID